MTITCQPMDATALSPSYSAQNERQAMAPLFGGGSGVALAARSGFRVGTPSNILTATSTTWTLGPCAAVISPGAATAQGSYRWSTDANATGSVTAADATYARKDIVYIQVNDSSSGDGSGALTAPVSYLAGTPSASPAAPTLPARSFLVGTITVPASGGGSPTVVLNPALFVAAGAPQPAFSQTERDALTAYDSLTVRRMDLAGRPLQTTNGTTWLSERAEHLQVNTSDGTWAYNVSLTRTTNDDGTKTVSCGFIVARVSGGAFTVNTGAWTSILTALIPSGWLPTDNVTVGGTYEFAPSTTPSLGSALFKFSTAGGVSACGVTGSFSCGSPTKLSATANWLAA